MSPASLKNYPYGPNWVRMRKVGLDSNNNHRLPSSVNLEFVKNLSQESVLVGHSGCVNCLEWNQDGTLLASGSDDRQVIVWNPFMSRSCHHSESSILAFNNDSSKCKRHVVKTQHTDNIFSVKFMHQTSSNVIATCASDSKVLLTDVTSSRNLFSCNGCHFRRVKRLVNHINQPQLFWSAGEDGLLVQYDIREKHTCKQKANVLIDLSQQVDSPLSAKCLAVSPTRDEMIAVGCDDIHIRLFDRRQPKLPMMKFVPGHLKTSRKSKHQRSFGTTYLAFSPDGVGLLANLHADQVYLFDTREPCENFKSFETNIKPLLQDRRTSSRPVSPCNHHPNPRRIYSSNLRSTTQKPQHYKGTPVETIDLKKLKSCTLLAKIEELNSFIETATQTHNSEPLPELYTLRASALMERDWKGDEWQAFRDCCLALALKPSDYRCILLLADISHRLQNKDIASGMLEMLRSLMRDSEVREPSDRMIRNKLARFVSLEDIRMNEYYNDKPLSIEIVTTDDQDQTSCDSILSDLIARQNNRSHQVNDCVNNNTNNNNNNYLQSIHTQTKRTLEFDYTKRFTGHCSMNTDIKEANFLGSEGEYIVAGSDDGAVYIWDKTTTNLVKAMHADAHILNCVQPHPTICMLATSGIEPTIKIWSTSGKIRHDIRTIEERCTQNQNFITADPLEAMVMMLYTEH